VKTLQLHFRRAVAELLVILGGVLGALWVEAFRESRHDARLERQYLERIVAEVDANLLEMERIRDFHRRYRSSALLLIDFLEGDSGEKLDTLGLAHAMAWAGYLNSESVPTATIDDFFSNGGTTLLRDGHLLAQILRYRSLIERALRTFDQTPRDFSHFVRRSLPEGFTRVAQECLWQLWDGAVQECNAPISHPAATQALLELRGSGDPIGLLREVVWYCDEVDYRFATRVDAGTTLVAEIREALGTPGS